MLYLLLLAGIGGLLTVLAGMYGPDDDERSSAMKDQIKKEGYHV